MLLLLLLFHVRCLLHSDLILQIGDLLFCFGNLDADLQKRLVVSFHCILNRVLLMQLLQNLDLLQELIQEN